MTQCDIPTLLLNQYFQLLACQACRHMTSEHSIRFHFGHCAAQTAFCLEASAVMNLQTFMCLVMRGTIQNKWPHSTTAICVNKHHTQYIHLKGNYKTVWCSRFVSLQTVLLFILLKNNDDLSKGHTDHTNHKGNHNTGALQQKNMVFLEQSLYFCQPQQYATFIFHTHTDAGSAGGGFLQVDEVW